MTLTMLQYESIGLITSSLKENKVFLCVFVGARPHLNSVPWFGGEMLMSDQMGVA